MWAFVCSMVRMIFETIVASFANALGEVVHHKVVAVLA